MMEHRDSDATKASILPDSDGKRRKREALWNTKNKERERLRGRRNEH
jgi:hypothetical protein